MIFLVFVLSNYNQAKQCTIQYICIYTTVNQNITILGKHLLDRDTKKNLGSLHIYSHYLIKKKSLLSCVQNYLPRLCMYNVTDN